MIYVAFRDSDDPRFVHRFLTPGFGHVLVLLPQGDSHAVKMESSYWGVFPEVYAESAETLARRCAEAGMAVLQFDHAPDISRAWRPRVLTCVSLAESVLGVWWPTVLTPRALYLRLLRQGAEPLTGKPPCPTERPAET